MAAPTIGWAQNNPGKTRDVTPPYLIPRTTLAAGETLTIDLLNVSSLVELEETAGLTFLKVAVSAAGLAAGVHRDLPAASARAWKWSTTKLVIKNPDGANSAVVSGSISLTDLAASELATLNEANGYDGVESYSSFTVA